MKFIVIYDQRSGVVGLNNIGVFEADTRDEARLKACATFTMAREFARNLYAEPLDDLPDGWSYYT